MPETANSLRGPPVAPVRGTRRTEILETAARLFATSGVRTSLKDIGDACGILPGSFYYHFASKEAIIIELVRRYQADLDRIASEALDGMSEAGLVPLRERVMEFCRAIAACAVRHPAALLMTLFEPPTGAGAELQCLVQQTPTTIHDAMFALLQADHKGVGLRPGIDPAMLGDRLCESMMRHGVTDFHLGPQAQRLPDLRCQILLDGLAAELPGNGALDASDARRAVSGAIEHWNHASEESERVAHLLRVARTEFARRGYDLTTLRDIAAASGVSAGTAYRLFSSKEDMLAAIIGHFEAQRSAAWDSILESSSTPLEKLDALIWLHIKLQERFNDEIRIQFSFVRLAPLSKRSIVMPSRLHDLEALLQAGVQSGAFRHRDVPIELYARCVYEALWTPDTLLKQVGTQVAYDLARDTVLTGALERENP